MWLGLAFSNYYIKGYIILLSIATFYGIIADKGHLVWLLNDFHAPLPDIFFKYITHVGDGIFILIVSACLIFFKYKYAIAGGLSYILSGIPVRILKDWLLNGRPRPKLYYNMDSALTGVEGVEIHLYNSFPSGHTASVFAFFCVLALYSTHKRWQLFYLLIAILVGISRIFLAQHFFEDVYAGSICGVLGGYLSWYLIEKHGRSSWNGRISIGKLFQ